jgi:hypothetical protein
MDRMPLGLDELVERWTVLADDQDLIAGKRGATRLGFALLLKFFTQYGRFPEGRSELPDEAVEWVARQVKVPASDLGFYEWSNSSTLKYHRAQIRRHFGFRECSVADQEKLTDWLAAHVANAERDRDKVRAELFRRCRAERIEPPTPDRVSRIVRSALHKAEQKWFAVIASRIAAAGATGRVVALVGAEDGDIDGIVEGAGDEDEDEDDEDIAGDDEGDQDSVLALVKSVPGNVSLNSMLTEVGKLQAVRAVGLPPGLFADVAPKVVSGWRTRAAVESPSHLRRRLGKSPQTTVTLLAALLWEREQEVTDSLVDLLIATVHRIGARAEQRVTKELISAFQKVTGKENILFAIAEASLGRPSDAVREVVYPAVRGGEATLRDLVREYKTHGPAYRRTVQTTLKASYTGHYRAGLIELLGVLEFRSTNTAHQPVVRALELIARYARAGNLTYYPAGETVPGHKGTAGEWADLVYRADKRGRRRTVRMVYEVATFQALREQLRCKEIWVTGAGRSGHLAPEVLAERLMLAVYAYGTNCGIESVASAEGHGEDEIRYVRRRYLTPEAARTVAVAIADATFAARDRGLWGEGSTSVASDSTHFRSWDQNLFTEWHSRYGGRGILVYWHVERGSVVVHSQTLRASASEVHAMVEGAIRHGTTMNVEGNEEWAAMLGPADRRGLTLLFWQHVRPYGEVRLDMGARLRIGDTG